MVWKMDQDNDTFSREAFPPAGHAPNPSALQPDEASGSVSSFSKESSAGLSLGIAQQGYRCTAMEDEQLCKLIHWAEL